MLVRDVYAFCDGPKPCGECVEWAVMVECSEENNHVGRYVCTGFADRAEAEDYAACARARGRIGCAKKLAYIGSRELFPCEGGVG